MGLKSYHSFSALCNGSLWHYIHRFPIKNHADKGLVQRFRWNITGCREQPDLEGTSSSNSFICIQSRAQFLPKEFADSLFNCWYPRSTSNYFYAVNVLVGQVFSERHRQNMRSGEKVICRIVTMPINRLLLLTSLFHYTAQWRLHSGHDVSTHLFKLTSARIQGSKHWLEEFSFVTCTGHTQPHIHSLSNLLGTPVHMFIANI